MYHREAQIMKLCSPDETVTVMRKTQISLVVSSDGCALFLGRALNAELRKGLRKGGISSIRKTRKAIDGTPMMSPTGSSGVYRLMGSHGLRLD